jgi:hypothetical protein
LFKEQFSVLGGFKTLIGATSLIVKTCLILPCLIPLVAAVYQNYYKGRYKRKMATHG